MSIFCFYLLCLISFKFINNELIGVIKIFRHGARTPLISLNYTHVFDKLEKGQLTSKGRIQMTSIGKVFRKKYLESLEENIDRNFLDARKDCMNKFIINTDYIRVYSIDTDRVMTSAFNFLNSFLLEYKIKFNNFYHHTELNKNKNLNIFVNFMNSYDEYENIIINV